MEKMTIFQVWNYLKQHGPTHFLREDRSREGVSSVIQRAYLEHGDYSSDIHFESVPGTQVIQDGLDFDFSEKWKISLASVGRFIHSRVSFRLLTDEEKLQVL